MKRLLLLLLGLVWFTTYSIELKVGQTTTLSITPPAHLDGCQWTISRPNDVAFTTTPTIYSTSVEVKAIHEFPVTSPCIVQCKYYYKELDPASGRYIYSRTGSKEWRITVIAESDPGTGGGTGGGVGSSRIEFNVHSMTIEQDSWDNMLCLVSYSGPMFKWEYNKNIVGLYGYYTVPNAVDVRGYAIGRTLVKCTNDHGGNDTCEVTVIPKSYYETGEDIRMAINDEILKFEVLGNNPKICKLHSAYDDFTQPYLCIPQDPAGYVLTMIGEYAFLRNSHIQHLVIPETVETIEMRAFEGCTALEEIILPENLTTIGKWAFRDASNLSKVVFPNKLTTIGATAFSNCKMETVILNEGLIEIGESAFAGVPVKQLVIPSTVRTIGWKAFSGPSSYESIVCKIEDPMPISDYIFNSSTYEKTVLYVPYQSVELYKTTAGWSNFSQIEAYDAPAYPSVKSLEEVIDISSSMSEGEYSDPFTVDCDPIVISVYGNRNYVVYKRKYCPIYHEHLGIEPGQIVKGGWPASLRIRDGLPELIPLDDAMMLGGDMVGKPAAMRIYDSKSFSNYRLLSLGNSLNGGLVYVESVIFLEPTPENHGEYFSASASWGKSFGFTNYFNLPSQPAGRYDVLAVVGDFGSLRPIEFISVSSVAGINSEAEEEYYNLQGLRIHKLVKGEVYIRKKGCEVERVIIPLY